MDFWQQLLAVLEKTFPGTAVGLGLQRGWMLSGFALLYLALVQIFLRPENGIVYNTLRYRQRVRDCADLAPEVAQVEAEAAGLDERILLMLKELDVRKGRPAPASPTLASGSPPAPAAPTLPALSMPPLSATPAAPTAPPSVPLPPLPLKVPT